MPLSRKKRTSLFRKQVETEWSEYYWKFLLKHPDKLDWERISSNPNITMDIIEKYPNKPWVWSDISYNPNLTMEIIEKYSDKLLIWNAISRNPNITIEIIENNPDKPWDWYYISFNPNITVDIIEKYPDKPWNWNSISWNPNITIEFIEKKLDNTWDWSYISQNTFNYEKELFIEKRMIEYLAAYRIQQYYWKALTNPHCQIGLNQVNRDYDKLFTEDGRIKLLSNF